MNKVIGALWGVLICALIMIFGGCRTKKAASTENVRRTYDSVQVVKEKTGVQYSFIDTTVTNELTRTITEYIFAAPSVGSDSAHYSNVSGPMLVRNADGSMRINYGLQKIRQMVENNKTENKGVSEKKDSTNDRQSNVKVNATEHNKKKDKQVEQVKITAPFDWWQILFVVCIPFAVIVMMLFLKNTKWLNWAKKKMKNIRNKLKIT